MTYRVRVYIITYTSVIPYMCVAIILSRIINAVVRDHQQYDRVVKQQFYKWFKKITRHLLLKIVHEEHQQNNWKEHLQFYKISWWWTLLLLSTCIFSLLWHFCEHPWLRIKFLRYVVYKPHLLLLLLLLMHGCSHSTCHSLWHNKQWYDHIH